ncbi:glycoside hydrolase family 47 protein [Amanita muscaria]
MQLRILTAITCMAVCSNIAFAEPVQKPDIQLPATAPNDREAVKQLFRNSYEVYRKYAFGHDEVAPQQQSAIDPLNGWGGSIVDGLGTMVLMGFDDLTAEAIEFIPKIDFSKSNTSVSVFETTIRYVGGLLSAYELTDYKYPVLLQKAQQVADKLVHAWDDGNVIPYGHLNFTTNKPVPLTDGTSKTFTTNIAEAGTLTVEFGTLSMYTKDEKYINLALKSAEHIAKLAPPLPGLAAQCIHPKTGKFKCGYVTWGGGSDSCYEYSAKYTRLFNPNSTLLFDTWVTGVDSSIKTLLKTSTVGNFKYLADYDNKTIIHIGSHLECFHAGNWILGGKMVNNQTIVDIGLELADACWNTYARSKSGIGPEVFAYISDDGDYNGNGSPSPAQLSFYNQNGFYIVAADYVLRPEVLESNFYAFRATGDLKYYKRAQEAVKSYLGNIVLQNGGADGLYDMDQPSSGVIDETESFWFAEVLKYLYLTFDDPNNISLDTHVFNTESHPLKAPSAKEHYGSGNWVTYSEGFSPDEGDGSTPSVSNLASPTAI